MDPLLIAITIYSVLLHVCLLVEHRANRRVQALHEIRLNIHKPRLDTHGAALETLTRRAMLVKRCACPECRVLRRKTVATLKARHIRN